MSAFSGEYVFKCVAVGSGGVGKTSLIRRFALNKFENSYLMTLGVDFTTKEIILDDPEDPEKKKLKIKLVLADTAGQEFYGKIRPGYYSGSNAAIIVFDLTNRNSFESLPRWIGELNAHLEGIPMIIVGNKMDLDESRRISSSEAEEFSSKHSMQYFETSAKRGGEHVDEVFQDLCMQIYQKLKKNEEID